MESNKELSIFKNIFSNENKLNEFTLLSTNLFECFCQVLNFNTSFFKNIFSEIILRYEGELL